MMSPAGLWHGVVAMRIGRFLGSFVDEHDLGIVLAAETGFKIESGPDTVRAPDASFVKKSRLKGEITQKFFEGVPDLAVEVVSPDDSKRDVVDKVNMWLASGTPVVWVADPRTMTVSVYRPGVPIEVLERGDSIRDEPLLKGFVLALDSIFKTP